jgi:hypothetical protein
MCINCLKHQNVRTISHSLAATSPGNEVSVLLRLPDKNCTGKSVQFIEEKKIAIKFNVPYWHCAELSMTKQVVHIGCIVL